MRPHVTRDCARCGKLFIVHQRTKTTRYCGRKCSAIDRFPPLAVRFWARVDRSKTDGCWPWTGACFRRKNAGDFPYGAFYVPGPNDTRGNNRPAHQVAWELANEQPFPEGKQGNHSCDFTLCCRPDHVLPGTQDDNMKQMSARGRSLKGDRSPTRLHPEAMSRGEHRYNAKLTDSLVRKIRSRWAELGPGYGHQSDIARELDLPVHAVNRIVSGRSWRHVA